MVSYTKSGALALNHEAIKTVDRLVEASRKLRDLLEAQKVEPWLLPDQTDGDELVSLTRSHIRTLAWKMLELADDLRSRVWEETG